MALKACLVLALACIALAARITFEAPAVPPVWRFLANEQPDLDATHVLHFSLKQSNLDELEAALMAVSTPSSPKYGRHWSFDEVGQLTTPSSAARPAIEDWLANNGIPKSALEWTPYNSWLRVTVSRRTVEEILSYEHTLSGRRIVRATSAYSLPRAVADHVNFVAGVSRFPRYRAHRNGSPMTSLAVDQTSNAPLVISNHQGEGQLQLLVAPRCEDGSFTTSAESPCSDNGSPIDAINVQATSNAQYRSAVTPINYALTLPTVQCQQCANWALYADYCGLGPLLNTTVMCLMSFSGLQNYVPYNVSVSTSFENATSDTSMLALPITSYPWMSIGLLRKLYNVPTGTVGSQPHNSQAVIEFLGQFYNTDDLTNFLSSQGLASNVVVTEAGSFNNQSNPGGEANLDIQYIMGLAPNISTTFFLDLNLANNGQEDFMDWMMYLSNHSVVPYVQSVSYDDQEYGLPVSNMAALNVEFQKVGLRGVTLLFAAGDDGVGGFDARQNSSFCGQFNPTFPGSSPWATSIGGTQLSEQPQAICSMNQGFPGGISFYCDNEFGVGEAVCSVATGARITTGGGFSNVNTRPSYQASVVEAYLNSSVMKKVPASYYNASGRAYPDISANAHNYVIFLDGQIVSVDGTSASTPVIAAMIALINDARLKIGMSTMGFLNPWLYNAAAKFPSAFVDITQGDNACTANAMICCEYGLSATVGWDATTGLGTPNFLTLRNIALNPEQPLPDSQFVEFPALIDHSERTFLLVVFLVLGAINLLAIGLMLWQWAAAHRRREEYAPIR